jgi:hypothetical protein
MSFFNKAIFLLTLLVALVNATGFLQQNCGSGARPYAPWKLDNAYVETYCNDHVCNVDRQTRIDMNRCIGNNNGVMTAQLE